MATLPLTGDPALIELTTGDGNLGLVPTSAPYGGVPEAFDLRAGIRLKANTAYLELTRAPGPPPYDIAMVYGRRQTWPAPALGSTGLPTNWEEPTADVVFEWGYIQILIGGRDVTFYRGVPTVIEQFGYSEPFDDDVCTITFPQITSLEATPDFLQGEPSVVLRKVGPPPTYTPYTIWEGFKISETDQTNDNSYGVSIDCQGALYDIDRYLSRPPLHLTPIQDIGHIIADAFYPPNNPGQKCAQMNEVATGIMSNQTGSWEPKLTGFVQEILASATTDDGNQWTIMKNIGRKPVLRLKDRTTEHWSIRVGIPGVETDFTRDQTTAPNIFFGEGVDDANCRWRNAVYPNLRPDDAPIFPGDIYTSGDSGPGWTMFENELIRRGYALSPNGVYNSGDVSEVKRFQRNGGISVDGAVGPQTWAVAFEPGLDGGALDGGFFAPLAFNNAVIPAFNGGTGGGTQLTPNPAYDPAHVTRREHYINWGSGVSLGEAARSSLDLLTRSYPADWIGTITLRTDPPEGHRFDMRAGQNIKVRGFKGTTKLFHIARAEINFQEGTVVLTVDEAGRDALTLAEIKQRNKDNATPTWKRDRTYRNSRSQEDTVVTWDCENGSGVIPRHATYRGLWNVLRIPAAAGGEIVRTEMFLDTPARFAAAVFDRPITAADLRANAASPLEENYWDQSVQFWDQFGDGLLIAWGGSGQAAGYYPGSESDDSPLTGVLRDDASWYYESSVPPWLWVAVWVESPTINYLRGRLYPGLL